MKSIIYICDTCNMICTESQILEYGCPHCPTETSFSLICDEPGCDKKATCGTVTENKYRETCNQHRPARKVVE